MLGLSKKADVLSHRTSYLRQKAGAVFASIYNEFFARVTSVDAFALTEKRLWLHA